MVIPAIDLRAGRCVRLVQGDPSRETVYSDDPVAVARSFAAAGARRLHVVDLDGAFEGLPRNLSVAMEIARAVDVPIQLGGGIRTMAAIEQVLASGIGYVILGTAAIEQPELVEAACRRFPGRVLVGIDARDGRVAVRGWAEGTGRDAVDLARDMGRLGVAQIIFTDIARDGTLSGPNLAALERVAGSGVPVIASGGVSSLDDLRELAALRDRGVVGAIVGKAIYTGAVDLKAALAVG
ncbi:MAG: 1-(5-phosphoribosyl)-5-[(5-phosphoribosylamino)methylideneamino]imidazole-4-carboxamide isomerase [Firmicutes bacterium ZCTH02-B6]|nr:MAG: 1-(5-phosphoribosyl)-5-[(5-phosphoribosylamino)methylideneamino]imidazole-4-carboxamide isomerase [Firmicutes bacterium ZCTH02-B6]